MKRRIFFSSLLSLSILLISCEGETTRTRQIENNTDGCITVIADGASVSDYNKTIAAGQVGILFVNDQRGGSDFVEDPANGVHSMTILNESGDTCTKDYAIRDNWEILAEQTKKAPSTWRHQYTFVVDSSDF